MIAVMQRVSEASVTVDGEIVGRIGDGLLVLLGVRRGDTSEDALVLAKKVCELRVFEDDEGRTNLSSLDRGSAVLAVSQFTLCADLRKGRRPGFGSAEQPERARELFAEFTKDIERQGLEVQRGVFGASMQVMLVNRGPATFLLDSEIWTSRAREAE